MPYRVALARFEALAGEWQRLLPTSDGATVFQTPRWLSTWWDHFHESWDLWLLGVWEEGELVGVAPLMQRDGIVSFIAETDLCDYHDFIVGQGRYEAFFTAVLGYLRAQGIAEVHLSGIQATSPTLVCLPTTAASQGFSVVKELEEVSPSVELSGTWEEFVQRLSKKDRHELRRKLRRLEEADPQYRCQAISDGPITVKEMGLFCDLMRRSREDKGRFMSPAREHFFSDLATRLAQEGLARLFFLEVKGARIASSLCFSFKETYYLYNSGYDPDYSQLSVGLLLKALCIKDAFTRGVQRFDFLRGAESYKYDLGAKDTLVYRLTLTR